MGWVHTTVGRKVVRKRTKDKVQATISIRVSGNQWILISETNKFGQKDWWTVDKYWHAHEYKRNKTIEYYKVNIIL